MAGSDEPLYVTFVYLPQNSDFFTSTTSNKVKYTKRKLKKKKKSGRAHPISFCQ